MSAGVKQGRGCESWKDSGHSKRTEQKPVKVDGTEQGREPYKTRRRARLQSGRTG